MAIVSIDVFPAWIQEHLVAVDPSAKSLTFRGFRGKPNVNSQKVKV